DPTYVLHEVVHYAVGNMPGAVPNTSTYALTNVTLPYVLAIAEQGLEDALRADTALAKGLNTHLGMLTNEAVAEAHDLDSTPISLFMGSLSGTEYADGRRYSASSVARTLAAVRTFHRFLMEEGDAVDDPSRGVIRPKVPRTLPRALPVDDVAAILAAPSEDAG